MTHSKPNTLRLPLLRAGLAALALSIYLFALSSHSFAGGPAKGGNSSGPHAAAAAVAVPFQNPSPSPSPSPGASPSPSPTPNASPSPTPNASPSPTPGATPGATPSPSPTPGASPTPNPSPTPGPTPGGEIEIEAPLAGAPINGVTPFGRAKFEIESGGREFEVEVRDVNLPRGTVLRIFLDGGQLGTVALDDQQRARFRLKTEDGQTVPEVTSRTRVVVADSTGATLLAGSFSTTPPSPNPTPVPTPTPGSGGETRVEAKLAGAAINGLTPRGEAEFRIRSTGQRQLKVEVEKVNLPSGTVLRVFVDSALAGQITLGPTLEGELELNTNDGQLVPQLLANSTVVVTNTSGATILSAIFNRPVAPTGTSNDIDNTAFFVEQQYKDFLDREPDDSGLDFWSRQIAACADDSGCRAAARINTSGAFFLSIEFQSTGYLLYRFNKASFGVMPRRNDFLIDMQRVAQGVVVGRTGWEQQLEANKRALADEWVARAPFQAVFGSLTGAQYVDTLFQRAGVQPSQTERDALVAGLSGGTETRATVLRRVAENTALVQRERNPAFVLMQYFGYLHRDPDDSGFNFWLQKLDNHSGDFHRAEMVKAFIDSQEYRGRFRW